MRQAFLSIKPLVVLSVSASLLLFSCSKQDAVAPDNSIGVHGPAPSNVIGDLIGAGPNFTYRAGSVLQLSWDTGALYTVGLPSAATSATLDFQLNGTTMLKATNVPVTFALGNTANGLYGFIDYDLPVALANANYHLVVTGNGNTTIYSNTLEGNVGVSRTEKFSYPGVTVSGSQPVTTSFQLDWDRSRFASTDYVRFYVQTGKSSFPSGVLIDLGVYSNTISYDRRGGFSNAVLGPQTAVMSYQLSPGTYNVLVGLVNNFDASQNTFPYTVPGAVSGVYETGGTITVQ